MSDLIENKEVASVYRSAAVHKAKELHDYLSALYEQHTGPENEAIVHIERALDLLSGENEKQGNLNLGSQAQGAP